MEELQSRKATQRERYQTLLRLQQLLAKKGLDSLESEYIRLAQHAMYLEEQLDIADKTPSAVEPESDKNPNHEPAKPLRDSVDWEHLSRKADDRKIHEWPTRRGPFWQYIQDTQTAPLDYWNRTVVH
jgi:hypothetical protein